MTLSIVDILILSFITLSLVSWNRDWKHVLAGLAGTGAGTDADSDPMTI